MRKTKQEKHGSRFLCILGATALSGFAFSVHSSTAQAGFEWTPPPPQVQREVPVVRALPVPEVQAEDNIYIEATPLTPSDAAGSVDMASDPDLMPVAVERQVIMDAAGASPETPENYAEVAGFGRDLPLALAMRQIVPLDYAYSFDKDVNPALRVSWDGGKPWNEVLKGAVSPFDLDVVVSGKTAWILPASKTAGHDTGAETTLFPVPETAGSVKEEVFSPAEGFVPMAAEPAMPQAAADSSDTGGMNEEDLQRIGMEDSGYNPSYPRRSPAPVNREEKKESGQMVPLEPLTEAPGEQPMAVSGREEEPVSLLPAAGRVEPPPVDKRTAMSAMPDATAFSKSERGNILDPFEIRYWQAAKGDSLRQVLNEWADTAGVNLFWNADIDYKLPDAVQMHGTFPDAVTRILTAYNNMEPRPLGRLHPNLPEGPSVLVIETP